MYNQADSDHIINLWWQARKIDVNAANYLANEVDQRAQAGRSIDCDALVALSRLAYQADTL